VRPSFYISEGAFICTQKYIYIYICIYVHTDISINRCALIILRWRENVWWRACALVCFRALLSKVFRVTLQHTATHCNTPQHTAAHRNTLQHTATHCNTPQHTAAHRNTQQYTATHCNAPQCTATHYNALQHTTAHRYLQCACSNVYSRILLSKVFRNRLYDTATHSNILQRTETHCNTLQYAAPHGTTLQETCNTL